MAVDREACALYKQALDAIFTELGLPTDTAQVVFTGNNNDKPLLKQYHLDAKQERQIRKSFGKLDQLPKILIVTEKLLTGFDAPVLYAMYLDKPLRELRQQVTFALVAACDQLEQVTPLVDTLFTTLAKGERLG